MSEANAPYSTGPLVQSGLVGIGGWLVLLAIGQALSPIRVVVEIWQYYADDDIPRIFEKFPVTMYGEALLNTAYIALVVFTTYAFFSKKRIFKTAFTVEVVWALLMPLVDATWVSSVAHLPIGPLLSSQYPATSLVAFAIGLIWLAYVWQSVRVRNTFVN